MPYFCSLLYDSVEKFACSWEQKKSFMEFTDSGPVYDFISTVGKFFEKKVKIRKHEHPDTKFSEKFYSFYLGFHSGFNCVDVSNPQLNLYSSGRIRYNSVEQCFALLVLILQACL